MTEMTDPFLETLHFAKYQLSVQFELKDEQVSILREIYDRNNCIGVMNYICRVDATICC